MARHDSETPASWVSGAGRGSGRFAQFRAFLGWADETGVMGTAGSRLGRLPRRTGAFWLNRGAHCHTDYGESSPLRSPSGPPVCLLFGQRVGGYSSSNSRRIMNAHQARVGGASGRGGQ